MGVVVIMLSPFLRCGIMVNAERQWLRKSWSDLKKSCSGKKVKVFGR